MSDRDELIAKARESMRQVRTIPWAYRYNGKHEVRSESVTSADGKGGLLIADRLPVEEAQYIANASVLLPALADLAESEGRRADSALEIIEAVREFQDASRRHMSQRKHVASGLAVASAKLKALVLPPKEQP
jgi:hypothetical protein